MLVIVLLIQVWNGRLYFRGMSSNQLVVLQRIGTSAIMAHSGQTLTVYSDQPESFNRDIKAYRTAERIKSIRYRPLGNIYQLRDSRLLVLDREGMADLLEENFKVLLLSNSPKINLDRVLQRSTPHLVIADGSNYQSFVERWDKSCSRSGIAFYNTNQKGALTIDLLNEPRASVFLGSD